MYLGDTMKKIIVFLFILTSILLLSSNKKDVIPTNNSIRFRIVASSNTAKDQALKLNIRNELLPELEYIENNSNSLVSTRNNIRKEIPIMKEKLNKYPIDYSINFGQNYFPKKEYLGVNYPAQEYESLVITLGDANGDNWWCTLFPPLCLIEAQKSELDSINYEFYIHKVLAKYQ